MSNHLLDPLFAAANPESVFLTLPGGESQTYGDILARSGQMANVLIELGVVPGDRVAAQVGKSSDALALYLASLQRARELGYDRLGIGMSRPFLNDGLLRYKRKWGLRLNGEFGRGGVWLRFKPDSESARSFLCNNPFLHVSRGNIHGACFTGATERGPAETTALIRDSHLNGMQTLQLVDLSGNTTPAVEGEPDERLQMGCDRYLD